MTDTEQDTQSYASAVRRLCTAGVIQSFADGERIKGRLVWTRCNMVTVASVERLVAA